MDFRRQLGVFDPDKHSRKIHVAGAGGIGGPVTLALTKMGVKDVRVWDHDTVEAHNQPNQLYGKRSVGYDKVEELNDIVKDLADSSITGTPTKYFANPHLSSPFITVSAVDSMQARESIYKEWRKHGGRWLVDGRLGGQVIRVYAVNQENHKRYATTIKPEQMVPTVPCTQAAVIDVMFAVGALVARACRLIMTKQKPEFEVLYDHRNLIFIKES